MTYYERNLPHWHPGGKALFITWRLRGSLPAGLAAKISSLNAVRNGKQFRIVDAELDRGGSGPLWLKNERVAECVVNAIRYGETVLGFYDLYAFVVMANHVHVLITPKVTVARITNGIKGVTSRDANAILGRIGMAFWQTESFDHWVRSEAEFQRIRKYIEVNPVSAGLVERAEEWRWSSAFCRSL
jgi:putative transposase